MAAVLLIGRRRGALRAARRLGLTPVTVEQPRRMLQADNAYGGTGPDALRIAPELLGAQALRAIVAVAEGAVPAAAALRTAYGLPGLSEVAAARCHDKLIMKEALQEAGVPCAKFVAVSAETTADELIDRLGLPVVLKVPVSSGGRGVRIHATRDALAAELRPGLLAESFVGGVEMSVETLQHRGRLHFRSTTRYLEPRWANVVPAELSRGDATAVDGLTDRVLAALGVDHGISHLELFLTRDGPLVSEVAARPPGGRIMELIRLAWGFDAWEELLRLDLDAVRDLPRRPRAHAGVWFLHPGPGTVRCVSGLDAARAVTGIKRVRCRVAPGDAVTPRVGSGQHIGDVIAQAESHAACVARLVAARDRIRVVVDHPPAG